MTEIQESPAAYIPDLELTEQALVLSREERTRAAERAFELQLQHEAQQAAAQQTVDRLGIVYAAINTQAKALREKMDRERTASLDSAVEALAEGSKFNFSAVSNPALKAELDGLMFVLADVAESRLPVAKHALATARIEAMESQGATMLRAADVRSVEVLRLGIAAAKFEGSKNITSALPDDGQTANLRRQGRNLIETADAARRALDREAIEKR